MAWYIQMFRQYWKNPGSKIFRLVIIVLTLTILYYFFIKPTPSKPAKYVILSWNDVLGFGYPWLSGNLLENDTPGLHPDCFFTFDRSSYYHIADVVIFNWIYVEINDIPLRHTRPTNQTWVLFTGESPCYTQIAILEELEEQINFTSSYRLDDDIPSPYGHFEKIRTNTEVIENDHDELNKNGTIIWMVSHCYTEGKREYYVRKLNETIQIDQIGACNKKTVPNCGRCYENILKCYRELKNYTFYLSMENSICKDYGTEKLFFAYHVGMIPIIFGGYNVSLLPENSYINAMDFENPHDLGTYLKYLLANPNELRKFQGWKRTHKLHVSANPGMDTVRKVCDYLRDQKKVTRVKRNHVWWWYYINPCFKWYRNTQKFVKTVTGQYEQSEYDQMVANHAGEFIDEL